MDYREKTLELINKKFADAGRRKMEQIQYLRDWRMSGKKICAFGAGSGGLALAMVYENLGIGIDFFCDNDPNKWEKAIWNGIICIKPEELAGMGDDVICTISVGTEILEDIYTQLLGMGIRRILKHCESQVFSEVVSKDSDYGLDSAFVKEQVERLFDLFNDMESQKVLMYKLKHITEVGERLNSLNYGEIFTQDQYFLEHGKFLRKGEMITDCGAFDGDTLEYLISRIGFTGFNSYTCYEPDEKNVEGVRERINGYDKLMRDKVRIMPCAVADKRRIISMDSFYKEKVEAFPLDDFLSIHGTSFLKMDIEGAEMDALHGAEKLLAKEQPNCAICVYHKISDMWNVPMFLHEKLPNHTLLLRHHQFSYSETVCYALRMEDCHES